MNPGSQFITNGRSLDINAGGDITTNNITTQGGNISIRSNNGAINTNGSEISSSSNIVENAGNINLDAAGDITTGNINSEGRDVTNGGNITITSQNGSISTNGQDITSRSSVQEDDDSNNSNNAGSVTLNAPSRDINVGQIDTKSRVDNDRDGDAGEGGDVELFAGGNINVVSVDARSQTEAETESQIEQGIQWNGKASDGGNITFNAGGNIQVSDFLFSFSRSRVQPAVGGKITGGDGGNIILDAGNNIQIDGEDRGGTPETIASYSVNAGNQLSNETFTGGNIFFTANNGDITIKSDVFQADPNLIIRALDSTTRSNIPNIRGNSGIIQFDAPQGDIDINFDKSTIHAESSVPNNDASLRKLDFNAGGDININSKLDSRNVSDSGNDGGIRLGAGENIQITEVDTRGADFDLSSGGDTQINFIDAREGNVSLNSGGNIQISAINAENNDNNNGGNVEITAKRFFRAIDTFDGENSISTANGVREGNITITHGGGEIFVPFVVGDAELNGSAGAITTGSANTIAPTQEFYSSESQGNIEIKTSSPKNRTEEFQPKDAPKDTPKDDVTNLNQISSTNNSTVNNAVVVAEVEGDFSTEVNDHFKSAEESGDPGSQGENNNAEENDNGDNSNKPTNNKETITEQPLKTLNEIKYELRQIKKSTNSEVTPAIIYVSFPAKRKILEIQPKLTPFLQLVLVTSDGKSITKIVPNVTREQVKETAENLRWELDSRSKIKRTEYLKYSQQLYKWILKPLQEDLNNQEINNPVFVMDEGLRSVPLATLHDGEDFVIRKYKYSFGLMPSMSLTDTRYRNISQEPALTMGASQFPKSKLSPLHAAILEIDFIKKLQGGESFSEESFTPNNLNKQLQKQTFAIVHIATHAKFQKGTANNSFIQFWNQELTLPNITTEIPTLKKTNKVIDLLVLSACETAVGEKGAELGFAGLAHYAGVKSVLASLWQVYDLGTLGLMTQFYKNLNQGATKADALRQAQVAMLEGKVRTKNGKLFAPGLPEDGLELPPELQGFSEDFSHPYYWSGFTIVGNPW